MIQRIFNYVLKIKESGDTHEGNTNNYAYECGKINLNEHPIKKF